LFATVAILFAHQPLERVDLNLCILRVCQGRDQLFDLLLRDLLLAQPLQQRNNSARNEQQLDVQRGLPQRIRCAMHTHRRCTTDSKAAESQGCLFCGGT
jgi:hypothetical protein